ncbi:MAG: hypothetical protein ACYYK0_03645 [Candidatus Eutrophobiaceae bacterium]
MQPGIGSIESLPKGECLLQIKGDSNFKVSRNHSQNIRSTAEAALRSCAAAALLQVEVQILCETPRNRA